MTPTTMERSKVLTDKAQKLNTMAETSATDEDQKQGKDGTSPRKAGTIMIVKPPQILPNLHLKTHFKAAVEYSMGPDHTHRSLINDTDDMEKIIQEGHAKKQRELRSLKKIDRSMFISNAEPGHHPRLSATAPGEFKLDTGANLKKKSGTPHQFQRLNLSKLNTMADKEMTLGTKRNPKTNKEIRLVSKFKQVKKNQTTGREIDTEGSVDTLNQVLQQK